MMYSSTLIYSFLIELVVPLPDVAREWEILILTLAKNAVIIAHAIYNTFL